MDGLGAFNHSVQSPSPLRIGRLQPLYASWLPPSPRPREDDVHDVLCQDLGGAFHTRDAVTVAAPRLLQPAFELQARLREKTCGEAWWRARSRARLTLPPPPTASSSRSSPSGPRHIPMMELLRAHISAVDHAEVTRA